MKHGSKILSILVIVINLSTFTIKLPNICILLLSYTIVLKIQLIKHLLINFTADYFFSTFNNDYYKSYSENLALIPLDKTESDK